MKIRSKSTTPRVINTGQRPVEVGPGETVEVGDDLGKSLCEQSDRWEAVKTTTKKEG